MNKRSLRRLLQWLHLDLTRNLAYDRMTRSILEKCLTSSSNCIDIGAHEGEMLEEFLRFAPEGQHWAFEPLPVYFEELKLRFRQVEVLPYALSDSHTTSSFQYVVDAPAYSGLKRRSYDTHDPQIDEIQVDVRTLDEIIPSDSVVDFMKVDVEGAEMQVFLGARGTINRNLPTILFEYGKGAGDHYGTQPHDVFDFFLEVGLPIYRLRDWLKGENALDLQEFALDFENNREYYFLATKRTIHDI